MPVKSKQNGACVCVCVKERENIFLSNNDELTISRRYNNRISSSGGIDSTLHVKLYTSSEPLNVGEINSAGPGRPEISMYFFVRPNALSATQLQSFILSTLSIHWITMNKQKKREKKNWIKYKKGSIRTWKYHNYLNYSIM